MNHVCVYVCACVRFEKVWVRFIYVIHTHSALKLNPNTNQQEITFLETCLNVKTKLAYVGSFAHVHIWRTERKRAFTYVLRTWSLLLCDANIRILNNLYIVCMCIVRVEEILLGRQRICTELGCLCIAHFDSKWVGGKVARFNHTFKTLNHIKLLSPKTVLLNQIIFFHVSHWLIKQKLSMCLFINWKYSAVAFFYMRAAKHPNTRSICGYCASF